jgi:hypothetical protein
MAGSPGKGTCSTSLKFQERGEGRNDGMQQMHKTIGKFAKVKANIEL